jgi:hypothetical protein
MERIVHVAKSFTDADEWGLEQQVRMTPAERQRAARELKKRVFPKDSPDVRECHRRE